jgi:hypothetical protein
VHGKLDRLDYVTHAYVTIIAVGNGSSCVTSELFMEKDGEPTPYLSLSLSLSRSHLTRATCRSPAAAQTMTVASMRSMFFTCDHIF